MNVAEIFAPGDFLQEELDARGWTQVEFAEVMGRSQKLVSQLITGKIGITPETAVQLGDALGTGAELWMNLESQYQLSKVKVVNNVISRRAKLYEVFPVREMIKRRWIEASENIEVLEHQFMNFFGMTSMTESPNFAHAAKKSSPAVGASMVQLAWLFRAKTLASSQVLGKYKKDSLEKVLPQLHALLTAPEEVRHVAKILSTCGVRFVLVEAMPGSKIDGACFWINQTQPVIALSLRFDRIDNFWFVLRHEIEHVLQGHGQDAGFILDEDTEGFNPGNLNLEEEMANAAAIEFCVPRAELDGFVARVSPYFSEERINLFAQRLGIHTGIVAGQLRKKLGRYDRWNQHLAKVRHIVIKSAPSDGWGLVENN